MYHAHPSIHTLADCNGHCANSALTAPAKLFVYWIPVEQHCSIQERQICGLQEAIWHFGSSNQTYEWKSLLGAALALQGCYHLERNLQYAGKITC